jgi:RNA 2',3'-cyclic 3'-phosphodiesterase
VVATIGGVFAAVPIPVEIRIALAVRLGRVDVPGRLVDPEDWHVTLRFLGRIDQVTCERFVHGLSAVAGVAPFRITLDRLGAFPNPRKASVVWLGIGRGVDGLSTLNEVAEEAAVSAGLDAEDRPFQPHLTLSRVRPPADVTGLIGGDVGLAWNCDRVVVFESSPGTPGPRYRALETFRLEIPSR